MCLVFAPLNYWSPPSTFSSVWARNRWNSGRSFTFFHQAFWFAAPGRATLAAQVEKLEQGKYHAVISTIWIATNALKQGYPNTLLWRANIYCTALLRCKIVLGSQREVWIFFHHSNSPFIDKVLLTVTLQQSTNQSCIRSTHKHYKDKTFIHLPRLTRSLLSAMMLFSHGSFRTRHLLTLLRTPLAELAGQCWQRLLGSRLISSARCNRCYLWPQTSASGENG